MEQRSLRFTGFSSTGGTANDSLNKMTPFFSKVSGIDLEDALMMAGLNAEYILAQTRRIAQKAQQQGVLKKYDITFLDAQCIAMYTLDLPPAMGMSPYVLINNTLCGPHSPENLIRIRGIIVLLLKSLRKLPRIEKSVVYRGIRIEDEAKWLDLGKEMVFWSFTSTSTDMTITNSFSKGDSGHLLVIEGPVYGYDIRDFSQFPNESEILLEPELVVEISGKGKDNVVIQCKAKRAEPVLVDIAPFMGPAPTVLNPDALSPEVLDKLLVEREKKVAEEKRRKAEEERRRREEERRKAEERRLQAQREMEEARIKRERELEEQRRRAAEEERRRKEQEAARLISDFSLRHPGIMAATTIAFKDFDNQELLPLGYYLQRNTMAVKLLSFSGKKIGDKGVEILSEGLKVNTSLTELDLRTNGISFRGVHDLCDVLSCNRTITKLDLSLNNFGSQVGRKLGEFLVNNRTLQKLNLRGNDLGDGGAGLVLNALLTNKTLTDIDLSTNSFGKNQVNLICELSYRNTVLRRLDISYNDFGFFDKKKIKSAWGGRKNVLVMLSL